MGELRRNKFQTGRGEREGRVMMEKGQIRRKKGEARRE